MDQIKLNNLYERRKMYYLKHFVMHQVEIYVQAAPIIQIGWKLQLLKRGDGGTFREQGQMAADNTPATKATVPN